MNKKQLYAIIGILIGFLFIFYAFEVVSVPDVHEYHEWVYFLIGWGIVVYSVFFTFYKRK